MKKQEMKVFTMYEGWDAEKEKQNRSTLVEKKMLAGMEKSAEFHEKREACIRKKYNADEIGQRVLNGDGGSWIKETYYPDTIFQLDRYHIYQEILRKIGDKEAQGEIRKLLEEEKPDEMLEYIMQQVWKVWTKRINEVKKPENYINILVITVRDSFRMTNVGSPYRNQRTGFCIKEWGYKRIRTVRPSQCE
ncbi:UPF0236 family transposase-like protein [Mediterraneibacter agrestimuris]|uniref:UPF0236 family transposase-like protein n=1 Tax=Mediterraneibacter agrestimuris TaxID=2941333 RepID=UPI00203EFC9B|nr:UPF0236 family protein [Mediterraneibacter agrestimuris]